MRRFVWTISKGAAVLTLAVVATALVVVGGVYGLNSLGVPVDCGGQCTSPYTLDVDFQAHTSIRADTSALRLCTEHDSEVVSVAPVAVNPNQSGEIQGIVKTTDFGGPKEEPLEKCLTDSSLVQSAGYPD